MSDLDVRDCIIPDIPPLDTALKQLFHRLHSTKRKDIRCYDVARMISYIRGIEY